MQHTRGGVDHDAEGVHAEVLPVHKTTYLDYRRTTQRQTGGTIARDGLP
jgi:hypothetical protein